MWGSWWLWCWPHVRQTRGLLPDFRDCLLSILLINVLLQWQLIHASLLHFCVSGFQLVHKNGNSHRHTYKILSWILLKILLQSPVGEIDWRGKRADFTAKDGNCSKELDSYLGHKNTISYFLNSKMLSGKVHPLNDNF